MSTKRDWSKVRVPGAKLDVPVVGASDRTANGSRARKSSTRAQRAAWSRVKKARRSEIRGLPPASDVKITRADGSVDVVPSKRPIDDRR